MPLACIRIAFAALCITVASVATYAYADPTMGSRYAQVCAGMRRYAHPLPPLRGRHLICIQATLLLRPVLGW